MPLFSLLYGVVLFAVQAEKDLGNFHGKEREQRKRDADQPFLPREIHEAEQGHQRRYEHDQRDDRRRGRQSKEQINVPALPSLEHGIVIGALVERVRELCDGEHEEGHRHRFVVVCIEELPDPVCRKGGRRNEQSVQDDAVDHALFKQRSAAHGLLLHHVVSAGSMPSATAGRESVARLISRTCTARMGDCQPIHTASRMMRISAMLPATRN